MAFSPQPERLRLAVLAYELAASIAGDSHAAGAALLKLGWVHRVLDDWEASTEAWDRCANASAPTKMAADALWLTAENLAWTDQPAASVERLRLLATEYVADGRVTAIPDRIEHLEAEARRPSDWLIDPVASIKTEIEARSAARTPSEVYRSVVKWLGRRGDRTAMIAVSRWVCTQDDWPVDTRIACRNDLVDALLASTAIEADRREAAERLGEIVDLAPSDAVAVPVAIRRSRLLNKMERFGEADRVANEIAARVKGSRRWEPVVLTERIESLLKRGEEDRAKTILDALVESHPDYDVHERFDAAFGRTGEEGSK
jgi:tetratricopeptide (TPR) repeat protein